MTPDQLHRGGSRRAGDRGSLQLEAWLSCSSIVGPCHSWGALRHNDVWKPRGVVRETQVGLGSRSPIQSQHHEPPPLGTSLISQRHHAYRTRG